MLNTPVSLGIHHTSCLFATEGSSSCTQDRFPCNLQNECRYTHKTTTRTATKDNFSVMLTTQKYNAVYYVVVTITRNGTERNTWFREIPILRNALKTS